MVWCKHKDPPCDYCQDKHDEHEWIITFSNDPFDRYRKWKAIHKDRDQLAAKLKIAVKALEWYANRSNLYGHEYERAREALLAIAPSSTF